ncbi:hypothetical protein TRVL_10125 [Trypanosoma vivax]|nr:hypothetical protein TRVL_10125 [Trypanosoma vivax]
MSALLCVHEAEPMSDGPAMHDAMVNICKFVKALRGAAEKAKLYSKELERDGASDKEVKVRAKLKIAQGIYRVIVNEKKVYHFCNKTTIFALNVAGVIDNLMESFFCRRKKGTVAVEISC